MNTATWICNDCALRNSASDADCVSCSYTPPARGPRPRKQRAKNIQNNVRKTQQSVTIIAPYEQEEEPVQYRESTVTTVSVNILIWICSYIFLLVALFVTIIVVYGLYLALFQGGARGY